jgi:hypothetical protein
MILLSGCSAKKAAESQFVEINNLPCQGMDSDADYIVANGQGKSKDMTMAKDRAYVEALSHLSSKLSSVASREVERVGESVQTESYEDFHERTVSIAKEIAEANVAGYRVSCEKTVKWKDGSYGHFVTLEYGKKKLVKQLFEGLSVRKMLKVDYRFDQFCQKFEEDLKDYEKEEKEKK